MGGGEKERRLSEGKELETDKNPQFFSLQTIPFTFKPASLPMPPAPSELHQPTHF